MKPGKPNKHTVLLLSCVVIALGFAWYIWPTAWRYDTMHVGTVITTFRTNRFTGRIENLNIEGWTAVTKSEPSIINAADLSQVKLTYKARNDSDADFAIDIYNPLPRTLNGDVIYVYRLMTTGSAEHVLFERKYRKHVYWLAQSDDSEILSTHLNKDFFATYCAEGARKYNLTKAFGVKHTWLLQSAQ